MANHSLVSANGATHAKIALLAAAASAVFVMLVSASGLDRTGTAPTKVSGVVKASTLMSVATNDRAAIR